MRSRDQKNTAKIMLESGDVRMTQQSSLTTKSGKQEQNSVLVQSGNLSMKLANNLLNLMEKVTKEDITADTVNAACNCATELNKLFKTNLEMKKSGF